MSESPVSLRALAPAKINLGLFLGPTRTADGRHELVSVMQSVSLADELTLLPAPAGTGGDEVICPGVQGPPESNLAAKALSAFRSQTGWDGPPWHLEIVKRIPVAAGLAGGSADAAATLRLASAASGLGDRELLLRIATDLGADVPAQLSPGRWLAGGAGEQLQELPAPRTPFGLLVAPAGFELSTAAVFAEADRLGLGRSLEDLAERRQELRGALEHGAPLPAAVELLHNDLQRAAVSLRPEIGELLGAVRDAGGDPSFLSGSGPTVLGLFARTGGQLGDGVALARLAADRLSERVPGVSFAVPVGADYGEPKQFESGSLEMGGSA
jgi:4-diphosphocytidyl-2-C-methyl-D-erythritol kinase